VGGRAPWCPATTSATGARLAEFVDVRARIHLGQRSGQVDDPVDDEVTTRSINSSPLNVLKILFSAWRDR
jgi:hypothetical protein